MLNKILIVDDDNIFRESLITILKSKGFDCDQAENGKVAFEKIKNLHYDIVVTDLEMPEMDGLELIEKINSYAPQIYSIVITAYGTMESAITTLRKGAYDYIVKPFKFEGLILKLEKLIQHKLILQENIRLRREINYQYDFSNIIGQSRAMKDVFRMIEKISDSDSTIIISGKSGTGKELVAKAIHYHSSRKNQPFIALNCAAVPENLIESELFGYKKGSFTGAVKDHQGLFQMAQSGSLFLDEIGDISLNFQTKLLRAIEQKEILPIGTTQPIKLNVRIIAATNRDLEKDIEDGRFREDLYYRLNVINIPLPPLEKRKSDIPLLANYFINKFNKEQGKKVVGITPEALKILQNNTWRGEVRELENIIERAMIFTESNMIDTDVLPKYLYENNNGDSGNSNAKSLEEATKAFQKKYILGILNTFGNHRGKTAKYLAISEPTLYRRLQELKII